MKRLLIVTTVLAIISLITCCNNEDDNDPKYNYLFQSIEIKSIEESQISIDTTTFNKYCSDKEASEIAITKTTSKMELWPTGRDIRITTTTITTILKKE